MFVNVYVTFRHSTFQNVALKSFHMYHRRVEAHPSFAGPPPMLTVAAVCSPGSEFQILRGEAAVLMADCAERRDTLKKRLVWGNKPWGRAWVENWTSPKDFLRWTVTNPVKGEFQVEAPIAGKAGAWSPESLSVLKALRGAVIKQNRPGMKPTAPE